MVKIEIWTTAAVPRILGFCVSTPAPTQWLSMCTGTIIHKTHSTFVYKDVNLTEWVFTDILIQKTLQKMLSNRFYCSFCTKSSQWSRTKITMNTPDHSVSFTSN